MLDTDSIYKDLIRMIKDEPLSYAISDYDSLFIIVPNEKLQMFLVALFAFSSKFPITCAASKGKETIIEVMYYDWIN